MLINKVSALGAVMPKEVSGAGAAQNFKTKPMGYDSVSFGMARVPIEPNPGILYEKLEQGSAEDFAKTVADFVHTGNKGLILDFLARENLPRSSGDVYPLLSQVAAQKEDSAYLKAIIDTVFNKDKPVDNRMLAIVMADIDYSKIKSASVKELCSKTVKHLIESSSKDEPYALPPRLIVNALKYGIMQEDDFRKPSA